MKSLAPESGECCLGGDDRGADAAGAVILKRTPVPFVDPAPHIRAISSRATALTHFPFGSGAAGTLRVNHYEKLRIPSGASFREIIVSCYLDRICVRAGRRLGVAAGRRGGHGCRSHGQPPGQAGRSHYETKETG